MFDAAVYPVSIQTVQKPCKNRHYH